MEHVPDAGRAALVECWASWGDRLDGLPSEAWHAPTRCEGWSVHALAAHLAPPPEVMEQLMGAVLDQPAAFDDAAALLRFMNGPGGAARSMATAVAEQAVADAEATPPAQLVDRFRRSAEVVTASALHEHDVVPHPVAGTVTIAVITDVALVEATVHLLDLVAAVGGPPPPPAAIARSLDVLVDVADPAVLLEVLAGRRPPGDHLPLLR